MLYYPQKATFLKNIFSGLFSLYLLHGKYASDYFSDFVFLSPPLYHLQFRTFKVEQFIVFGFFPHCQTDPLPQLPQERKGQGLSQSSPCPAP